MARKEKDGFLDYKEKQKILYIQKTPPDEVLRIANRLLDQDRFSEAYDYIERAGDEKRIEEFMYKALERGDFFNFDRAARRLDIEVEPDLWAQLADNAAAADMFVYAVEAYRRAGRRQKADDVIRARPDFFGPSIEMEREAAALKGKMHEIEEPSGVDSAPASRAPESEAPDQAPGKSSKKKKKKRKRK
jgi:hypothetical protein